MRLSLISLQIKFLWKEKKGKDAKNLGMNKLAYSVKGSERKFVFSVLKLLESH